MNRCWRDGGVEEASEQTYLTSGGCGLERPEGKSQVFKDRRRGESS